MPYLYGRNNQHGLNSVSRASRPLSPQPPRITVGFSSSRKAIEPLPVLRFPFVHRKQWFENAIPLKNAGDETRDHSAGRNDAVRRIGGRGDACRFRYDHSDLRRKNSDSDFLPPRRNVRKFYSLFPLRLGPLAGDYSESVQLLFLFFRICQRLFENCQHRLHVRPFDPAVDVEIVDSRGAAVVRIYVIFRDIDAQ